MPLSQFVTFEYEQDYPLVWRRDRVTTLTVEADIRPGALPETVVAADRARPSTQAARQPAAPATRIDTGGTVEESAKSQASVVAVVPLMLFIMLTVLMAQLQSFGRLAVVLSIAPLGLIGVVRRAARLQASRSASSRCSACSR